MVLVTRQTTSTRNSKVFFSKVIEESKKRSRKRKSSQATVKDIGKIGPQWTDQRTGSGQGQVEENKQEENKEIIEKEGSPFRFRLKDSHKC